MSFILDALKKSEAERQRQAGPTLLEVRVMPPRRRLPVWAIVVAVLLAANLLALVWFVARRSMPGAAPAAAAIAPVGPAAIAAATTHASAPAPAAAAAATSPDIGSASESSRVLPPTNLAAPPSDDERNAADFAPAVPAGNGTVTLQHDLQSLPSFSDVAGTVPSLHLDLHVYSPSVPERYALINMHKVHEGDVLPEGARVIQITRDGVVLDYRGQEFILGQQSQSP